jgi:hypothetical protein
MIDETTASTEEQETNPAGDTGAEDLGTVKDPEQPQAALETKVDPLEKMSVEEVLNHPILGEALKRQIQSEKDKEIARERRRAQDETQRRAEEIRRVTEESSKQKLVEEGDYEGLGKLEAERLAENKRLAKYASTFSATVEQIVKGHPEYSSIGEDRMEEIFSEVKRANGNIVDFTARLAEERRTQEVDRVRKESGANVSDLVKSEVEARLAELGLADRSKALNTGEAPSTGVSGSTGPKPSKESIRYDQASEKFGAGDMSWAEFKPYLDDHKKKLNG